MPLTETEIANMALAHIGWGLTISSLTESSKEARACNAFFATARDEMLREFPFPFATKLDELDLVSDEDTAYNREYYYAYRYPSDCIYARKIQSGLNPDTRDSAVPYKIIQDSGGLLILTNVSDAILEYTKREDTMSKWDASSCMALSYRLSAYIYPRLFPGDTTPNIILQMMALSAEKARAACVNEEMSEKDPESEFITGR